MKGFDVLHVKSAVKSRNKFDLSRTHLTTGEFGQVNCLFCEETVPGDKFNVNANYFSRMAPLVKPTYGRFSFRTMAGFVPYYQIADDAEAFIAGKTTWEGRTPILRYFNYRTILTYFISISTTVASTASYDFVAYDSAGALKYYKLSNDGRFYLKVMNSLGYVLPEKGSAQTSSTWYTGVGSTKLSAYPLLAFFKLYNDWMSQSQRYNTSQLTSFLYDVKHGNTVTGSPYNPFDGSTGRLSQTGLDLLFSNLKLCYENDYFTSAWQNAVSPLATNESINSVTPPAGRIGGNGFIQSLTEDSFLYANTESISNTVYAKIGQRSLDFLKSFDDYVRRNNYSGSRAVQQVYSRFGIKTSDYRDNYAEIIKTDISPVQVGDVTSQSDATGAVLGDYAGKGIMSDGKGFSYEAKDYGMLLVLGWFTVTPMNPFGFSRHVLRNEPFDWYTPEFDGIGAEAIPVMELYEDPTVSGTDTSSSDNVFGFTERYNSYRFGRDQITGDFRDFQNIGQNVWHTGRYLTNLRTSGGLYAQSVAMNTFPQSGSEYNRIFNVTSSDVDHFYLTCNFGVSAVRPMLNLNQVPKLGEGDTNVPRNGNTVN